MAQALPHRELPHNSEAEVSVLGAMILLNDTIDVVTPIVKPEHFAGEAHTLIHESILRLHENSKAVDLVTLRNDLDSRKKLEAVGGSEYLAYLIDAVPSATNAEHYARIVRDKALSRDLISAVGEIQDQAYQDSKNPRELLDVAEQRVFRIAEGMMETKVHSIKDVLKSTFERIDKWSDREDRLTGLATGYYDLDDLTSGLQDSELIVLAARPSVGKTSLALNIAEYVAVKGESPVAFFSLEMSKEQLARNMLCSHARLDSHRLRRGLLQEKDHVRLALAVGTLSEAPIFVDDTPGLGLLELRAKARRLRAQRKIKLVIVDYLQLMGAPPADSREQQISAISRGLKTLARELGIPIIAVSQLNRGVERRDDHRPRMADLRESGAIEQDADVVLLLHREAYYTSRESDEEEDTRAELIVAKQRNGPTGKVLLTFLKEFVRFESSERLQDH